MNEQKDIAKENSYEELRSRVMKSCKSDNIKDIQIILTPDCYPKLTQEEKEHHVFMCTIGSLKHSKLGYHILKYLILDYGIREYKNYIKPAFEEADELFAKRKIKEELSVELDINSKSNKKPKV